MGTIFDTTLENTGAGIADLRHKHGYTQEQAAQIIGIDRKDISRIEAGNGGVTWRKVLPYLDLLGIQLPKTITLNPHTAPDTRTKPEKENLP